MKRALRYIKGYIPETVLAPLFKLCEAALELTVPLVIADIIDKGIKQSDTGYVLGRFVLLICLGAAGLCFSVTAQYFAARASVGYAKKMRMSLYSHIQTLSYAELDGIGTSTLITRLGSDTDQVQTGLNLALRLLLRSPFVVFGAMIMAFTIDVKSALTFVAAIPALAIVVYGIMFISMPMHKRTQEHTERVTRKVKSNLDGVRVMRAFAREDIETEEFAKENGALATAQRRVGRVSALLNPLTFVIINIAIVALIHTGALKVEAGELTTGQVIALYNYMSQILVELIKLANLIVTITKAVASGSRINAIFDIRSSIVSGTDALEECGDTAVEFRNVSMTYPGAGAPSLSGINFTVRRGETVGVIGATGSGKTTLINLIPRFYDATEGEVLLYGKRISEYDTASLCKEIGIATQRAALFSGTIRENMRWGKPDATDEEILAALDVACAGDIVRGKDGLDTMISEGGTNISGGQKQRLSIARAIISKPSILILDDTTSALDYKTDAQVRSAIRAMSRDITTFIVSQRASSLIHADKIITLDEGTAVGIGTHSELLDSCLVYREIYLSQFGGDAG